MDRIPVIDIRALDGPASIPSRQTCIAEIDAACRDIGFLSITGTGVPEETVRDMRAATMAVFDTDDSAKWRQAITRENYRGYIPMGFFSPNDGSGTADLYEGYKLHAEVPPDDPIRRKCALYGPNLWPDHAPEVREPILRYWAAMDRLALRLLAALAEALNLPSDTFDAAFVRPMTNMTMLHYPPQAEGQSGFGIHPHKDTDALTIIAPDPVGGLEVQTRRGGWIAAQCPPGGFVVNIGDMLELWSGGRLISTPHRVINRSGHERYAFPYFAVPSHNTVVAPLLPPLPGFDRPSVHCGHWSAEIWRTNWPDQVADADTPELGTIHT